MTLPHKTPQPVPLWQAYLGHNRRTKTSIQPALLGEFSEAVINGIAHRAARDPGNEVANLQLELQSLLSQPDLHMDETCLARARCVYETARRATFPASAAYLDHTQELAGLTHNVSMMEVDLDLLMDFDLRGHEDPAFGTFVAEMIGILDGVAHKPDANRYSQFFEIYAEAMVLDFLRGRGIKTSRVSESHSAADFRCELSDGRPFYVEVKTLDIVGGEIRHKQIMNDGLEPHVELERQQREGRQIASAFGEIAPYRKAYGDAGYDAYSVKRVIDTLREKCFGAFKSSQFEGGPTFALVVTDRLILHGWRSALTPYYYDEIVAKDGTRTGDCVSGMIWQAAFGTEGTPVLRKPDFEGKPNVEGYLDKPGLYVDAGRSFPGVGLVVLQRSSRRRLSYGLMAPREGDVAWSSDDTIEALSAMCDAWNDQANTRGFALSRYEIEH